ncbi:bifunctional 3-oxoadipate enol-lactonase/4-carboxymuconolactone decarboxylase PcaDC [Actinacidiphila glaucinigra]|uniref:3-oxoadipate enol-lactonase / 4-carboxymuconolactone decarboxylase n=1 Tax=Actinacidiphila glaucinigra TaxID=235986 RepID=A0A239CVW6_9ACTN|nr:4-carboxymuconolactone decarboxylase [Actinacidiphila glaucinigra]SNS24240.1 3-oxoadipate enol-lactonase / 4-carboxymuconolactone decarboxylase [Actinacidiphila glaucinigra]
MSTPYEAVEPRLPHHRVDGAPGLPPLILGPSLGTSLAVWDPQVPALARGHRVIRWDLPGHGGSPASLLPEDGTVEDLARAVLALADALGAERFAYAGISLGGAVGTWLAIHHPERVTALAIVCSSADFGDPDRWRERAGLVRAKGTGPVADTAAGRWFTPDFGGAPAVSALVDDLRAADPEAYATLCDALAAFDVRADLPRITAPTLVVAGRGDPATPVADARVLADGIPGASLTEVAHAAHLAGVERPAPVLAALLQHFATEPAADDGARHTEGMAVRRAVLGDAHVDRAIARTTAFTAPFQDLITRYAWGEIWTRPGLSRGTRSCITLTALVAHGHLDELAMHVRAARHNGLTREEIQEVLLQSAVYCGVPAANAAFAVANRVLEEEQEEE